MSTSHKGKHHHIPSEESRKKMSEAHMGHRHSDATKEKFRNRKLSPEMRTKLSLGSKKRWELWRTSETKETYTHTAETRALLSAQQKGRPKSEEHKRNLKSAWEKRRADKERGNKR